MDVLEGSSENMERITGLMDKIFIKLDKRVYHISHRFTKREGEVRIGRT